MNISITGNHIDLTDAIKAHTNNKFGRLSHFDKITTIHVIFNVEKLSKIAEAIVHFAGNEVHAKAHASDLYAAIDDLVTKLEKQIRKLKEKATAHRG